MYVCVCSAVKESDIHEAMNNGICSPQVLKKSLNIAQNCGNCSKRFQQCVAQHTPQHQQAIAS